jgi:hypothetical protein
MALASATHLSTAALNLVRRLGPQRHLQGQAQGSAVGPIGRLQPTRMRIQASATHPALNRFTQ